MDDNSGIYLGGKAFTLLFSPFAAYHVTAFGSLFEQYLAIFFSKVLASVPLPPPPLSPSPTNQFPPTTIYTPSPFSPPSCLQYFAIFDPFFFFASDLRVGNYEAGVWVEWRDVGGFWMMGGGGTELRGGRWF